MDKRTTVVETGYFVFVAVVGEVLASVVLEDHDLTMRQRRARMSIGAAWGLWILRKVRRTGEGMGVGGLCMGQGVTVSDNS